MTVAAVAVVAEAAFEAIEDTLAERVDEFMVVAWTLVKAGEAAELAAGE